MYWSNREEELDTREHESPGAEGSPGSAPETAGASSEATLAGDGVKEVPFGKKAEPMGTKGGRVGEKTCVDRRIRTTSGCSGVQALTNLSTVAESEKENAVGMNSRRSGVGQIGNNGSPAAGAKAVLSVHPHDIIINLADLPVKQTRPLLCDNCGDIGHDSAEDGAKATAKEQRKLRRRGEGGGDGLKSGEEFKQEHIGRGRATATVEAIKGVSDDGREEARKKARA